MSAAQPTGAGDSDFLISVDSDRGSDNARGVKWRSPGSSPSSRFWDDQELGEVPGDDRGGIVGALHARWAYAKDHWQKEKILMKEKYKIILMGAFYQYVHSVATNVVYYLHVPREPLRDLGFMAFPALSKQMQVLSEIMFFVFLFGTIFFALSPFVRQYNRPLFFTIILHKFFSVCICAQTLRMISFLVTVLPGPNYHCRPGSTEYSPPKNLQDIFFRQDAFFGCGDLIFSSHTIFVTLCGLTLYKYANLNRWQKAVMFLFLFAFGVMVVAARKHYSIDVVAAWYTVPLLWIAHDAHYPDTIPVEVLDDDQEEELALIKKGVHV